MENTTTTITPTNTYGFWLCKELGSATPIVCPHGFIVKTLTYGTAEDLHLWAEHEGEEFANCCEQLHPHAPVMARRRFVQAVEGGDRRTQWRQL